MERLKSTLISLRLLLGTAGPFIVFAGGLLVAAYWFVDPMPPRSVVIATGPAQSDYEALGRKYQAILARHGVRAELRGTLGSRENAELLGDPGSGVDVAFARSGAVDPSQAQDVGLESLGSLFYEPVWLFHRSSLKLDTLRALRGLRVELGPDGSGTPSLIEALLRLNGLEPTDLQASRRATSEAVAALLDGNIDALFLSSASDGLLLQLLLRTPGIRLFDFSQAEAYTRRIPSLNHVVLPRGVVDLAADMPRRDVHLLAPVSTLLARTSLHPGLVELLVQAASEVHGQADWFARPGQFPSAQYGDLPVAKEAARFYRSGPPFLQRYLPFWMANLVDRMWVVLLSLGALLIPLSRILPPIYEWRVRSRVYRWYGELKAIERDASAPQRDRDPVETRILLERLSSLEQSVNDIRVPLSYADEVYFLRGHIDLVRRTVTGDAPATTVTGAAAST